MQTYDLQTSERWARGLSPHDGIYTTTSPQAGSHGRKEEAAPSHYTNTERARFVFSLLKQRLPFKLRIHKAMMQIIGN